MYISVKYHLRVTFVQNVGIPRDTPHKRLNFDSVTNKGIAVCAGLEQLQSLYLSS